MFPYHSQYFQHIENLELLFCPTGFVDKIIRGNVTYNLFYQLEVNTGKYLATKGNVRDNNECLFSRTFPFFLFPLRISV